MDFKSTDDLINLPVSNAYTQFKKDEEELAKLIAFEKLCKLSYKYFKVKAPKFLKDMLDDPIYLSELKASSDEVFSLTITSLFVPMLFLLPLILFLDISTSLLILFGIPLFISYNVLTYPPLYADIIRIKAGNETVDIVLYMVIYLSLNPVFEKAIQFTASNCHGPLGKDFKKIMWDVEMGKYTTIKEAVGQYSKKWTIWNDEFVTSIVTLQMTELQPSQKRRQEILEEALDRTLRGTYAKMKNYAYELKIPSAMLLSFGIIFPLMGLIMFPMISIFLTESVNPIYLGVGYVIVLPYLLWWYLKRLISKRPSAFSHSEKSGGVEPNKYITIPQLNLQLPITPIAILLGLIFVLPGVFYFANLAFDYNYYHDSNRFPILSEREEEWKDYCLRSYGSSVILGTIFQAMFCIWGITIAIAFYCYFRSKEKYELEEFIRKTEADFEVGLFELQTALTQNIPIELAIPNVLDKYERMNKSNSPMYLFFDKIYGLLTQLGMTFNQALFDEEFGVLKDFKSPLIQNIMNIVATALSKGPLVVSNAARNIVNCLKRTKEIETMINDLLEDIISNLKTQTTFIAPLISGIVASIGVLVVQLLQAISFTLSEVEKNFGFGTDVGASSSSMMELIKLQEVMPPTLMELIVGLYLIECVVIMCIFLVGVQKGFDEVSRDYYISRNLIIAVIFYSIVFFAMIMVFQPIIINVTGTVT